MKNKGHALNLQSDAFNAFKTDFNSLLKKTIYTMEQKEGEVAKISATFKISLTKDMAPDPQITAYAAEREVIIPKIEHKLKSLIQIQDERSGVLGGEKYEMVWDKKLGEYVIREIKDGPRIILSDTSSPSGSRIKYALWSALKTSMQTALQAVYAPLSHASRHASTGQDAISPSAIGAAVPAKEIETTLLANGWVDSTYTLSGLVDITTESKGVVGLSDAASIEQRAAARSAQLSKIGQSAGSITIVSDGIVPTVDIPITIMIIS